MKTPTAPVVVVLRCAPRRILKRPRVALQHLRCDQKLPYQVNKARLQERIAEMAKERKVEGVRDVRDESDSAACAR
ncbi:MAG: hypothetical protein U0074_01255 [Kouleothrix sp.]